MALTSDGKPVQRLRDRKKAKTKASIQQHALRLFQAQGYDKTTVEEIAEAAEVSPSTFFRYFPTKEDVVLADEYDDILVELFHEQPDELSPMQAIRRAFRSTLADLTAEDIDRFHHRFELVQSVPALRAAMLDDWARTTQILAELIAQRLKRDKGDFKIQAFAGALQGISTSVAFYWVQHPEIDLMAKLDEAMEFLEQGLPLN